MKNFLIAAMLLLVGCSMSSTAKHPYAVPLKTYSYHGDKDQVFVRLSQALATKGFNIALINKDAGIITTDWKGFEIRRGIGNVPWPALMKVQFVVKDSSIEAQFTFQCGYGASSVGEKQFGSCSIEDSEALSVINDQEKSVDLIVGSF